MDAVSSEIFTAVQQIIVNGAALLTCAQSKTPTPPDLTASATRTHPILVTDKSMAELKVEGADEIAITESEEFDPDWEIVELDAMELLAEHIHFCEICGKGFKRDANLRMHMRAHGNQFKTPEALAKPLDVVVGADHRAKRTRFSCPYDGCVRNKMHKKFRALKSLICVKNHFKRSHCPKMFSCNRCNKKSFSVMADLKSHLKHCGESKWRCSCGTTFSRKDKLFGHMALFEGHMPAVPDDACPTTATTSGMDEDGESNQISKDGNLQNGSNGSSDDGSFESFLDGFGLIENQCLEEVLGFPNDFDSESEWKFCGF